MPGPSPKDSSLFGVLFAWIIGVALFLAITGYLHHH